MDSQPNASERGGYGKKLSRRKLIASFGLIGATFATGGLMRTYASPGNEEPTGRKDGDAEIRDGMDRKIPFVSPNNPYLVETIAQLRALSGMSSGNTAVLFTTGRAGLFRWTSLNKSGEVANDPQMGIYAPSNADPTGSSGCWVRERSTNIIKPEWFGAIWDGTTDDTSSIQHAVNFAEPDATIVYSPGDVRVDGSITLSKPAKHIAMGTCFRRTSLNNTDNFFHGQHITGVIEMKGARFYGSVDRTKPGFLASAACIRFDGCSDVRIYEVYARGGASGIQAYTCSALTVVDTEVTGNVLTGVSGISNNVSIKRIKSHKNGYVATGLTHEVYFLNSSNGSITDSEIGDPVDPSSSTLVVRYDQPQDDGGAFSEVSNWSVLGCTFYGGVGVRFNSIASTVATRKPVKGIKFFHNECSGGAGLRIDEPERCVSANNVMDFLTVAGAAQYPGYAISFVSQNDRVKRVNENVLTALRLVAINSVRFENITVDNGTEPAFNVITGYGGIAACSIVNPIIEGTGVPFDSGFLTRYRVNRDVKVLSATGLKQFNREDIVLETSATYTPDNNKAGAAPFYLALSDPAGTSIQAPSVATEGMALEMVLRNTGGTGMTVSFDSVYKLTALTTSILGSSSLHQFMYLKFMYIQGAWRQLGEGAWTQA
ncbi:right-handed parallel beta-helix repeat-containing protein [Paenibacillus ginsengarvi]|uniref:Right-handed parallel beta-helix repeat-containing protein n=1 Tax=Paenibacillus ginsengarvi TaxID=400777 RepID=A0A3B0CUZ9_9BACL|nr:right-handed parallel beta-helix repeat-containing protein [Paenibacillus ginsengarvi]RKN86306.1 right-handed parallel beta-helix repeat-containing protein [Paenibacillus ginsengarvi]